MATLGNLAALASVRSEGAGLVELGNDSFRVQIVSGPPKDGIPRFDASARVVSARRGGVEFLIGDGLVDEFNIRWVVPPGYTDGVEGAFLKIGVGVLQRTGCAPYRFWTAYPILKPARTSLISRSENGAVFEQRLDDSRWSYVYRKAFQIDPRTGRITIFYSLENRGADEIAFDQYNHTWLLLDPATDEFPWILKTSLDVSPRSVTMASVGPGRVEFENSPLQPMLFPRVQPAPAPVAKTTVMQGRKFITAITRFRASRFALFVTDTCLAPEVFAAFRLPPGGLAKWERSYVFGDAAPWPSMLWRNPLGPACLW